MTAYAVGKRISKNVPQVVHLIRLLKETARACWPKGLAAIAVEGSPEGEQARSEGLQSLEYSLQHLEQLFTGPPLPIELSLNLATCLGVAPAPLAFPQGN
jgi:hypothetical protein